MPSTQIECTVSEPDIQSVEKLFSCKEATLELEDAWLESVHSCTKDSTIIVHALDVFPVIQTSNKMDFKSMEIVSVFTFVYIKLYRTGECELSCPFICI